MSASTPTRIGQHATVNDDDNECQPSSPLSHPYDLDFSSATPTGVLTEYQQKPLKPAPGIIRNKKVCRLCKKLKPFVEFATDNSKKGFIKAQCKDCYNSNRNQRKRAARLDQQTSASTSQNDFEKRTANIKFVSDKLAGDGVAGVIARIDNATVVLRDYGLAKDLDKKRNPQQGAHPQSLDLIGPPAKHTPLKREVSLSDPPVGPSNKEQEPKPDGYFMVADLVRNGRGKLRGKLKKAVCDNPACLRNHTQAAFTDIFVDELPDGTSCLVLLCVDCHHQLWQAS